MNRRALLVSLGAAGSGIGSAGCVGRIPGVGDPSLDVSFDAEVRRSFGDDGPAQLTLTFANRTDAPLLLRPGVMQGIPGPFTAIRGRRRADDRELLLFYTGIDLDRYVLCADVDRTPVPDEPVDGCWRPVCREGLEIITAHGPIELEPGEELIGEYTVLDGFDDGCLRPGTYEFDDSTAIGRAVPGEGEFESEAVSLERRLAVAVEEKGNVSVTASAIVGESEEGQSR
ncbi:hypothetical protein AArcSl_3247 [Halalkaliarchaeum desulfuricum]|uniref:Lipoprotein n=1 Tax=Halalkaliarchaeum desulfuricum TaxID=2055893 RepID=A0A343TP31_9EURY|nr:hypothetical protein [Halalkaliarchaeum desulfuricum]AUX10853.1 hypothetical protein AArcSl_3247 [Halalkaliarchaeum desulfuricum]